MALWRYLLIVALTLGSVMPHCASAVPTPATSHHAGMAHDEHQPAKAAHVDDACIGCATPVRMAMPIATAPMVAAPFNAAALPILPTRMAALDPPPPRRKS